MLWLIEIIVHLFRNEPNNLTNRLATEIYSVEKLLATPRITLSVHWMPPGVNGNHPHNGDVASGATLRALASCLRTDQHGEHSGWKVNHGPLNHCCYHLPTWWIKHLAWLGNGGWEITRYLCTICYRIERYTVDIVRFFFFCQFSPNLLLSKIHNILLLFTVL